MLRNSGLFSSLAFANASSLIKLAGEPEGLDVVVISFFVLLDVVLLEPGQILWVPVWPVFSYCWFELAYLFRDGRHFQFECCVDVHVIIRVIGRRVEKI